MTDITGVYRGRFAPSPTGPLHLGSLLTALASYLDARAAGGRWLLRIEDIDPPREVAGASAAIIESLRRHGLHWDGDIVWQSQRRDAYWQALLTLREQGHVFPCSCTRAEIGPGGSCGERCRPEAGDRVSWRLRISTGDERLDPPASSEDVILWRKDDLPAYTLAVVVDDLWQQISHVVRGADLLEDTSRQQYLMHCLGSDAPHYRHVPLLCDGDGRKLSKQNGAPPLDDEAAAANLRQALALLGQVPVPPQLSDVQELIDYATRHWCTDALPPPEALSA